MEDYERQFDEEHYLIAVIGPRFRTQGWLDAYDLFFIVRWKANRAISKVGRCLVRAGGTDLDRIARELTHDVYKAPGAKARFVVLSKKWKLRLPMASAMLTVFYPDDFTVYDERVCDALGDFHRVAGRTDVDNRWQGYLEYKRAVEKAAPERLPLRGKDKYLWARSRHEELKRLARRHPPAHGTSPTIQ